MDISVIDQNLASFGIEENEFEWTNSHDERFSLHGVSFDEQEGLYMRVPDSVSKAANPNLLW